MSTVASDSAVVDPSRRGITDPVLFIDPPSQADQDADTEDLNQSRFDDDGVEEDEPKEDVPMKYVAFSIVISVFILCIVMLSILISMGHLGPLTSTPVSDEKKVTFPNPTVAGGSAHEQAASIRSVIQSPFVSSIAASMSNGMFSADDVAKDFSRDDDSRYEDAPRLAAFMGLRYVHHHNEKDK